MDIRPVEPVGETTVRHAQPQPLDSAHPERRREVRDQHSGLRAQFLRAGATGLVAGGVAVLFNLLLILGREAMTAVLAYAHSLPAYGLLLWPLIAAPLAMTSVWLVQRFAPETSGSGIPHIKGVLQHRAQLRWRRVLPVKLLGGFAALTAGLSLGREGPTVQMGAAAAQLVARFLRLPRRTHSQLVAAGAGAGLAAAFNSPLAGFIFVIEELRRELSPLTSSIALIAAITADVVTRVVLGQQPSFQTRAALTPPLSALPLFFLIGVLAAFAGLVFTRGLVSTLVRARKLGPRIQLWGAGLLAGLVALTAWWWPELSGGGYESAREVLRGHMLSSALIPGLLLMFALRLVLTTLSYATDAPGGIFAPMLSMAASLGLACGLLAAGLWTDSPTLPVAVAVVAMAALFAAVVRAPLTGIVLILEMTANYELLLPLMVAAMTAFLIAERLRYPAVYDALLELSTSEGHTAQEALWFDVTIESGSQLEGLPVGALGWPDGCQIVTILRGSREIAPRSSITLQSGDLLRVVADSEQQGFTEQVTAQAHGRQH